MMRTKYRNRRTHGYASKREFVRSCALRALANAGIISELREQVRFELIPKQDGERPVHYVADFVYRDRGGVVVEDVKGFKTEVYKLKRKLMLHVHGIRVKEV
jgi:Protein of unknown function (DUF1064)